MGLYRSRADDLRTLFISDEAYARLNKLAQEAGFINKDNVVSRGIARYITHIMRNSNLLRDTRPDHVRDNDEDMIGAGIMPEWTQYAPRKRRCIALNDITLTRACAAAYLLHITSVHKLEGAPDMFSGRQCLSILLEAIGTDWITFDGEQQPTTATTTPTAAE
jgi:hypothetical protein